MFGLNFKKSGMLLKAWLWDGVLLWTLTSSCLVCLVHKTKKLSELVGLLGVFQQTSKGPR